MEGNTSGNSGDIFVGGMGRMKFYRCRCGKAEMYGSESPKSCEGCEECQTTLAEMPSEHRIPTSHDWVSEQGLFWCRRCGRILNSPEGTLAVKNEEKEV
jgi:hypothetical protein